MFFDLLSVPWRAREGLLRLSLQGRLHPLYLVKSEFLLAVRVLVAAVKSKIDVAAEDVAVLNLATKMLTPDAVAPGPLAELFVGPFLGVLPGFISYQYLAFWAGVKVL